MTFQYSPVTHWMNFFFSHFRVIDNHLKIKKLKKTFKPKSIDFEFEIWHCWINKCFHQKKLFFLLFKLIFYWINLFGVWKQNGKTLAARGLKFTKKKKKNDLIIINKQIVLRLQHQVNFSLLSIHMWMFTMRNMHCIVITR